MPDATSLSAGFMVVHGNRLDELRSLVVSWMRRYPLAPLENEIALVQSNGIAQWLKLALAEDPEDDDMGVRHRRRHRCSTTRQLYVAALPYGLGKR